MRTIPAVLAALLLGALSLPAQQPDYGALDGRPFNPKTDPDIDLFLGHWKDNPPRHVYGSLIERDILTKSAGDPLKPHTRSAVLTYINRLSYGTLDPKAATTPSTLSGEQVVFYIDSGAGTVVAGGKTADLHSGVGVLMPPGIEFVLRNTGTEPLTMYIIAEPVKAGFSPNREMKVVDENRQPILDATGHWSHIFKNLFAQSDGLSVIGGMGPVWFDAMTMGQPHSHNPGFEEIWFSLEGDPAILLGKQVRPFPAGTAYKIPPDYMTPHSTINIKGRPVKVFWFIVRTVPEPPPPSYSMLDGRPFDLAHDADIERFMGNWRQSMPKHTHGSLVERDILTKGDPLNPPARGAVLKYVNRYTRASLSSGYGTTPTTLRGEQEILFITAGKGTITAGKKTFDLYPGIAVLIPAGLEFTMRNTGAESLDMYLINEPVPAGFRPNRDLLVVDENTLPATTSDVHWCGIVKQLFTTDDGIGTMESILTCTFSPMTFFQPHSHVPGTEEVWTGLGDANYVLFGKQIRHQPDGTAYLIPTDNRTPHANFNLSEKPVKLFYFARYKDHDVRK